MEGGAVGGRGEGVLLREGRGKGLVETRGLPRGGTEGGVPGRYFRIAAPVAPARTGRSGRRAAGRGSTRWRRGGFSRLLHLTRPQRRWDGGRS